LAQDRTGLGKIEEEIEELKNAASSGDKTRTGEELGDLLFSIVNLARSLMSKPRGARRNHRPLHAAVSIHETKLHEANKGVEQSSLEEMDKSGKKPRKRIQGRPPSDDSQPASSFDAATYGDISLQLSPICGDARSQVTIPPTPSAIARHSIAITNKVAFDKTVLNSPERWISNDRRGRNRYRYHRPTRGGEARRQSLQRAGYATQSVAQFTMALILELATRTASYAKRREAGRVAEKSVFSLLSYPSVELRARS